METCPVTASWQRDVKPFVTTGQQMICPNLRLDLESVVTDNRLLRRGCHAGLRADVIYNGQPQKVALVTKSNPVTFLVLFLHHAISFVNLPAGSGYYLL